MAEIKIILTEEICCVTRAFTLCNEPIGLGRTDQARCPVHHIQEQRAPGGRWSAFKSEIVVAGGAYAKRHRPRRNIRDFPDAIAASRRKWLQAPFPASVNVLDREHQISRFAGHRRGGV